jgi:hypothetical protein
MIESQEQYKAGEEKLKELLASFAAAGDLMDADEKGLSQDEGNWQGVAERVAALKKELDAYRDAHPEEFKTNG